MAILTDLTLPIQLLSTAVYVPAGAIPGSTRPTGKGLTGSDLSLLFVVLDEARKAEDDNIVRIDQTVFRKGLGKASPERIAAAFERLRGTDIHLSSVMPAVLKAEYVGTGTEPRAWIVTLDRRAVAMVKAAADAKLTASVPLADFAQVTSRLSVVLYGRWRAWRLKCAPASNDIVFQDDKGLPSYRLLIPFDRLGEIFGFYKPLQPSWIRQLLVTKSPKSPLHELLKVGMHVDGYISRTTSFEKDVGYELHVYAANPAGIDYLAERKNQRLTVVAMRAERAKQYRQKKAAEEARAILDRKSVDA